MEPGEMIAVSARLGGIAGGRLVTSANSWGMGAVAFVQVAADRRATTYRERAAHLLEMADTEPIVKMRDRLRELAAKYQELAASVRSWGE